MPSTALDYISVKGFKSISTIEKLPLRAINILIGANGSGKSNFMGVFSFLHAIREGHLRNYVTGAGGAERLLHFGSKMTKEMSLHLSFKDEVNQYALKLSPTTDDGLYPSEETAYFWREPLYPSAYATGLSPREQRREAGISNPESDGIVSWVRQCLGGWRLYHLHDTS